MNLRTGIMALTMAATGVAGHAQQAAKTMTKNDCSCSTKSGFS